MHNLIKCITFRSVWREMKTSSFFIALQCLVSGVPSPLRGRLSQTIQVSLSLAYAQSSLIPVSVSNKRPSMNQAQCRTFIRTSWVCSDIALRFLCITLLEGQHPSTDTCHLRFVTLRNLVFFVAKSSVHYLPIPNHCHRHFPTRYFLRTSLQTLKKQEKEIRDYHLVFQVLDTRDKDRYSHTDFAPLQCRSSR